MVNKKMLSVVAGGVLLMMNSCGTGSKAISSVVSGNGHERKTNLRKCGM